MSDLLEHLAAGIACISSGDTENAHAHLRYCAKLDESQCDVWMAAAAAHGDVPDHLLEKLVATKHTYDQCFTQLGPQYVQIILDRPPRWPLKFAGFELTVINPSGIDLAYAASFALKGQYSRAEALLPGSHTDESEVIRTWMFHSAGRFTDVLASAKPLLYSSREDLVAWAHLFTGIAHAHLGNFGAAREHLSALLVSDTGLVEVEPAAEAAYFIALTFREENDNQAAAQYFQRALSLSAQDRFQQALTDDTIRLRVTNAELIARRTDPWDVTTEPTLAEAQAAEMDTRRDGLLQQGFDELDAMIGMTELKESIHRHCGYMQGLQKRAALGMRAGKSSTHLVFAGPPGTGKTTVAKIVAKIYAGLGIIKTDKVVIAGRGDFVGMYQGHTTPQVKAKLNEALDGVLFIDEAYALVTDTGSNGSKDSFGSEAVTEIVAFMEEHRDRIVVIIAGYRNDIDRLLATNEGWSSRFNKRFDFRSYGMDQLLGIATAWCDQEDYILSEEALDFLRSQGKSLFSDHVDGKQVIDVLGNGRFVRNLMELSTEYALYAAMETSLTTDTGGEEALRALTRESVQRAFIDLTNKQLGGV